MSQLQSQQANEEPFRSKLFSCIYKTAVVTTDVETGDSVKVHSQLYTPIYITHNGHLLHVSFTNFPPHSTLSPSHFQINDLNFH